MTITKQGINCRPARLAFFIALALAACSHAAEARDFFNPELIELDNPGLKGADLSAFESGSQLPGRYRVDVILDKQVVDTRDIDFKTLKNANGEESLQPCLSVELLKSWGVKTSLFPDLLTDNECANLAAIPHASADFTFSSQRLDLSIPQAALTPTARGYVPPEQWDEGISAAMMNYSLTGSNSWARSGNGADSNSQYANLRPGFNIGPWRVRNYTTWNRGSDGQAKWDTVYTYAQRAIIPLKAQFTSGDSSSPSDVFDSIPFRGAQLASDDDMLPDSLKGYAPVVKGIARTNAQIVIRQNGYVIYQSYVAPGAFEITDMFPTGGSGDLNVTVKEADGSEQHFTVPFASVPVLQREGRLKYAATAGQYRSYNSSVEKTPLGLFSAIYGLPRGFTIYGGLQEASKYQSLAAGVGKNMGDIGALSVDVTQAWSTPKDMNKESGQSWRIRYSKNFIDTGTNFAIAGYRYSTSGYYGMQEVLDSYGDDSALQDRRRNRMEVTLNQTLSDVLGAVTLSAVSEDYWNSNKTMQSYSLGYNNSWEAITYGLTYTYNKNGSVDSAGNRTSYDKDQLFALNISVPLDAFLPKTWANYAMNSSKNGGTTHQVGLSGTALENNALSWNAQQGYGTNGVGNTGSLNGDYRGTYADVNGGYGYDKNSERLNYGIQGGVLAHADGVTMSLPLGETNVLIKAPGAHGVDIENQVGVTTDWRGYTVANGVTPYRKNDMTLVTDTLPEDAELDITTRTVIPTRGAVVRASYNTNIGLKVLMTLNQANGYAVPFGSIVTLVGNDERSFIVGDHGQVYLTGMPDTGKLLVKWGSDNSRCATDFTLPKSSEKAAIMTLSAICH